MAKSTAYTNLEETFKRVSDIDGARAILHWDYAAMMPSGGATRRIEQFATLESITHELLSASKVSDLLDEAEEQQSTLSDWEQANLREMRRIWRHKNAVDGDLAVALTRAGSECEMVWREARHENDFARYAPLQQKVLDLVREVAAAKSETLGCSPYDAMIDQYDPGLSVAEIDPIFEQLKKFLPDFIQTVLDTQAHQPAPIPFEGPFSVSRQKKVGMKCMKAIGFDLNHGRLDESHHPFCGGIPTDVRITTRYNKNEFITAIMGIEHEAGHAMYENNLPEKWLSQPVGNARGMAMHESQSLLVEMQACRSWEFLSYLAPTLRTIFKQDGKAFEVDNLFRTVTRVKRSFIRVDADEVTYPAHIMLRYDLEKKMIAGELKVKDLPGAWNAGMKKYLGVTPPNDKDGCMQDIHWTDGSLGYFPSYSLGAMIAAQLFAKIKEEHRDVMGRLARGDFSSMMGWLKTNIHSQGSRYSTREMLIRATGQPLNAEIFMRHLKQRYLGI
jgi:carboxypeptidase Taq